MRFFALMKTLASATAAALTTARNAGPRTPDHARLGALIGEWTIVGDMMASGLSPGGHFAGVHRGAWDFDGNFVVVRYSGTDNGRPVSQMDLYGWDADSRSYTYDSFNSLGQRFSFIGSVGGDTWTWTAERTTGGRLLHLRFVQRFIRESAMTFTIETSTDGAHWSTAVRGEAKRAG